MKIMSNFVVLAIVSLGAGTAHAAKYGLIDIQSVIQNVEDGKVDFPETPRHGGQWVRGFGTRWRGAPCGQDTEVGNKRYDACQHASREDGG